MYSSILDFRHSARSQRLSSYATFRSCVSRWSRVKRSRTAQVSVVITTFNLSHFLARAIESVKANTVQPLDILVVDDGSSDHLSEEICSRYRNVRYFRQANQGVTVARNLGAEHAQAEWILFVDADDWLLPTAIAELERAAARSPEVAFVIGRSERQPAEPSSLAPLSPAVTHTSDPYRDLAAQATEWHPAQVLFNKRRVLESGGFVLKHGAEDFELLLRLAVRYPYKIVPDVVSVYWQHSTNVTGNPWRQYRSVDLCFRVHRKDPMFVTRSLAVFRTARARRLDFYARGILLSGLSEIRKTSNPAKLFRGLAFVAVRRPPVIVWFVRFLFRRIRGNQSTHTPQENRPFSHSREMTTSSR
jgi:glycosyltransferase involved in cell wall biosynthesis